MLLEKSTNSHLICHGTMSYTCIYWCVSIGCHVTVSWVCYNNKMVSKWSHALRVLLEITWKLRKSNGLAAWCRMLLFHMKTVVWESRNFELVHQKKQCRLCTHKRHCRLLQPDKSAIAEHAIGKNHPHRFRPERNSSDGGQILAQKSQRSPTHKKTL